MEYITRKIQSGVYQYTFENGMIFNIVRICDADKGTGVQGKWFYESADGKEGGQDHFKSKSQALECLIDYIKHRDYSDQWGWFYNSKKGLT